MERLTRSMPHLILLAAVLLFAAPLAAQASSAGATGAGTCTNLSPYNPSFLYVLEAPKSDRVSIQIRPIGYYLVRSTQYGSPNFSFYQNEYDVFLDLLQNGLASVTQLSLGQVSYDPRLDLAFGIEQFTDLEPDTPYTFVQHAGNLEKPISRICFRTAADPNADD
ncbi:MAG: hypothetical protein OXD00_02845 [Gammaproteobacteria bacterium]|nr:hypothetical protein [Gammaproteobacteria bacterium]MCY4322612.1 hypothetical protein [Gammaproteobacteria bacterium]